MFDLLKYGEGIDGIEADALTERDHLRIAQRTLVDVLMNPTAIRWICVRNQLSKPLKKRRRGLSAKTASGNRGRSQVGRQRLAAPRAPVTTYVPAVPTAIDLLTGPHGVIPEGLEW